MNILFINHMGFLGGGEKSMLTLMDGLKQTGEYTTGLLAPEGELLESARSRGHQTFTYDFGKIRRSYNPLDWMMGLAGLAGGVSTVKNTIVNNGIDLIHANSLKAAIIGGMAAHLAKRPMIFHTRDFLSAGLLGRYWVRLAYALSARVIVNSKSVSQIYGSDPGKKVAVVYNYVTPPVRLSPKKRKEIRLKNGISEKQYLAGYVGRLHPDKGIETLLEGFRLLLEAIPDFRLWIVGGVMPGEDNYRQQLEQLARKLGVSDRVLFFGWRKDAPELMSCFDVLTVPSKKEPFGRVTIEAMMLGIPVVATASGGTLEIVEDNKTGLLFGPGDSRKLAQRCRELFTDPDGAGRMAQMAKAEVEKRFSAEKYITGIKQVYDSLPGQRNI